MRKTVSTLVILFLGLIYAQTEYPHTHDNGGGYREGAGYRSYASIGQAVIGKCNGDNFTNQAGYLTGISAILEVHESPQNTKLPDRVLISPAYPNPFNSYCQIDINLPDDDDVVFEVYDIFGRKLYFFKEHRPAGVYSLNFNASNLESGVYLYRVMVGQVSTRGRLILVK